MKGNKLLDEWAVMLSGQGCDSLVACPDWTWEMQDTWMLPTSPFLYCQRHPWQCLSKTSKQGGQGELCQAGLTSPACMMAMLRRADTPHPQKNPRAPALKVQTWPLSLTVAGKSSFRHRTCFHLIYSLQKPI